MNPTDCWVAYFDEQYTQIVNCEAFHTYKTQINPNIQFEQFLHKEYLESKYPFWSLADIIEHQKKQLEKIKMLVIFADINSMKKGIAPHFKESRIITAELMKSIQNSSQWDRYKTIKSIKYGNLGFFIKK